ncbi:hypothetical protein [Salmonirosea aquatica]|uniref:hypothetical protein n=1 Tax=Salmonirosea aquatica TaxID=2654236 RepID=UPI00357096FF
MVPANPNKVRKSPRWWRIVRWYWHAFTDLLFPAPEETTRKEWREHQSWKRS